MTAKDHRDRAAELRALAAACQRPQGIELLIMLAGMHEQDADAIEQRTRAALGLRVTTEPLEAARDAA